MRALWIDKYFYSLVMYILIGYTYFYSVNFKLLCKRQQYHFRKWSDNDDSADS